MAFSGHRLLMEEAMQFELARRGLHVRDLPYLAGDDLKPSELNTNLAPYLAPSLFGQSAVVLDLEGQKSWKELFVLIEHTDALVCVLDATGPATRAKFYKDHGEHYVQPSPSKTGEVVHWITGRIKQRGFSIDAEGVKLLAELFGTDLALISAELLKLEMVADRKLSRADVARIVNMMPPGDTFAMLEAATRGQVKRALEQLTRMLNDHEEPFKLMGAIVWQYNMIARCAALCQQQPNISADQVAKVLGIKPYPAQKALEVARKLSEKTILQHLERILATDFAMKSGIDPENALERLVLELSLAS